jgi:hypothetical protein
VCACDPFCCEIEWEAVCSTIGFYGTGCGAAVLCENCSSVCGDPCSGSCCQAQTSPGCNDAACCEQVCACDPYCCGQDEAHEGFWDANCAGNGFFPGCGAAALCADSCAQQCPAGTITWDDPDDGTLDARRPHLPANAGVLQGIQSIRATVPDGAEAVECWTLCESTPGGAVNSISSIASNGDGTVTINLTKPLTAGQVTRITYTDDLGTSTTGTWTSHPANANADGMADAADITALTTALGGAASVPDGLFYRDMDRSGRFTPADLLELVDLLNGAAAYLPWLGTPRPVPTACP